VAAEGACTANAVRPGRLEPWVPLLFTLLAAAVGLYQCPKWGDFARAFRDRLYQPRRVVVVPSDEAADGVTPAIGGTLGRIVMMQVATIIGGMFARTYGDMAPWLILIGLKTLFDYQRPDRRPAAHR
jgi:hypothetical protein